MSSRRDAYLREEDEHRQAFGEHTNISADCRCDINWIRENEDCYDFGIDPEDAALFSNLAWQLLGRYIANNDNVEDVELRSCHLTDAKMALLFGTLTESGSISTFNLSDNLIGIEGVRSMIPFLKSAPELLDLNLSANYILSRGFELIIQALHDDATEIL